MKCEKISQAQPLFPRGKKPLYTFENCNAGGAEEKLSDGGKDAENTDGVRDRTAKIVVVGSESISRSIDDGQRKKKHRQNECKPCQGQLFGRRESPRNVASAAGDPADSPFERVSDGSKHCHSCMSRKKRYEHSPNVWGVRTIYECAKVYIVE